MNRFLAALSALVLMWACAKTADSPEETPPPGEEETDTENLYKIVPEGELLETKAKLPESALYVLSVYADSENAASVAASEATRHAHGVFSDPDRIYVRMDPGKKYYIQIKVILHGENILYHEGKFYEGIGTLDNRPHYFSLGDNTDAGLYLNTSSGAARTVDSAISVDSPEADTYYGEMTFRPSFIGHRTITMKMIRCSFALKLIVNGMDPSDNPLHFSYTVGPTVSCNASIPAANPVEWEDMRTFPDIRAVALATVREEVYKLPSTLNLYYSTEINGILYESHVVKNYVVQLTRNKCKSVTVNLDRNKVVTFDALIGLSVEDEDICSGDSYDFDGELDGDAQ